VRRHRCQRRSPGAAAAHTFAPAGSAWRAAHRGLCLAAMGTRRRSPFGCVADGAPGVITQLGEAGGKARRRGRQRQRCRGRLGELGLRRGSQRWRCHGWPLLRRHRRAALQQRPPLTPKPWSSAVPHLILGCRRRATTHRTTGQRCHLLTLGNEPAPSPREATRASSSPCAGVFFLQNLPLADGTQTPVVHALRDNRTTPR